MYIALYTILPVSLSIIVHIRTNHFEGISVLQTNQIRFHFETNQI